MIKISDFSYDLPRDLIAKTPAHPRSYCRLLVYSNGEIFDDFFYNLGRYLKAGDLLVLNDSKVFPARLYGQKKSGGKVEILLLEKLGQHWQVLVGGKINEGEKIIFTNNFFAKVIEKFGKEAKIKFNLSGEKLWRQIEKIGKTPIPPYIKNTSLSEKNLRREYQTVYARVFGSSAAPTAGLHFTKKLIGELKSQGIEIAEVNLHVGLGTFVPISDKNIRQKKLHPEKFSIPRSTMRKIIETKKSGGRIIAVGTTTVRALESAAKKILPGEKEISGATDIFIQPGFKFKIIDGLITNFHLPHSSLMMLVAAFLQSKGEKNGQKKLLDLYQTAIRKKYRFYSFGDAMLVI